MSPLLCVVVCAAGPASQVGVLVALAREAGWTVRVVVTPAALDFVDGGALAALAGSPVRSAYRAFGASRSPIPDAVIVAPATFNTVNKLAAGIADNYALNVVAEAIGRGVPVVLLPFVNSVLAGRLPFRRAVELLRAEGVTVLFETHPPGVGDAVAFPWERALAAVQGRSVGM
ncbi:flavoprotein [Virgisporangium aliadipatigenens]|uniref:Flavoprotein n=1 Tax=Virgisporangium aliadipatigenens TaxID=741659 RepID=A0A8J3YLU1_9ACTN|nr:flavoprotein [Virgisporangium aliadipatigenens]GIJ46672.1 flavoprotein [Virgisporangium aliadipatigenens]